MPRLLGAALFAGIALVFAGGAQATEIDCTLATGSPSALANATLLPGGTYEIAGNCVGDVTITASNVTLRNFDVHSADTITGNVTVTGARNVTLFGNNAGNILGLQILGATSDEAGQPAALHLLARASVKLENIEILGPQENGILAEQNATVVVQDSIVTFAGQAGHPDQGNGIVAQDGATAILQTTTGESEAVQVSASLGYEILATTGTIIINGANGFLVRSTGIGAISATAGSSVRIAGGLSGGLVEALGSAPTIFLSGSSSLLLQDVSVTGQSAAVPVIQVSTGSSFQSAGGNSVCTAACDPSGFAVEIDHGSSMVELNGSPADAVTGAGMVQEQSSIELGTGAATPSSWVGTVTAQQNSSLRMSGGMAITGQIVLDQASNGFFNLGNGGTNAVSGGVACPFTAIPASHVSGPGKITPPVAVSADPASATSPNCLAF
jgi:hypothetical protein